MQKIEEYVYLLAEMKVYVSVSIEGLLGVVKMDNQIIFTTAGIQSAAVIEAFLGGMLQGAVKMFNIASKLK